MCEECRHYPCISSCPNYEPAVAFKCDGCGGDIYIGDTMYVLGKDHYCEECCYKTEAEIPEPDEDFEYECWRDRQLMDEWERNNDT